MIFDPFGDFESRGYLRNKSGLGDPAAVKEFEHRAFLSKLEKALDQLSRIERLSYRDVLTTHRTLFEDVYPWAGQDRAQTMPDRAVVKGPVLFAHPNDAKRAVDHALQIGQDKATMASKPGEVMGYLAYGHPFLDGNGRTILIVHTELAQRAGFSIDWAATDKAEYLTALTQEIDRPGKGHLDAYLKPFVRSAVGYERLASHVASTQGLSSDSQPIAANEVLGRLSDPAVQARYALQEQRRAQECHATSPTSAGDVAQMDRDAAKAEAKARDEKVFLEANERAEAAARTPDGRGGGRSGR